MIRPKTPLETSHAELIGLLQRLLHPEDLGHNVTSEVRTLASQAVCQAMQVQAEHEAAQTP